MSEQEPKPVNPLANKIPDQIVLQVICDMNTNRIEVKGPIHIKGLCIKILADAIQIIVDQPAILKPQPSNGTPAIVH